MQMLKAKRSSRSGNIPENRLMLRGTLCWVQEHLEGSQDEGTPTEYERSFVSLLIYYSFKLYVLQYPTAAN